MKLSLVLAAAAVSASAVAPRANVSTAPNMPSTSFPKFEVISLPDAMQGKDRAIQGLPSKPIANLTAPIPAAASALGKVAVANKLVSTAASTCAKSPNYRFEWEQFSSARRVDLMTAMRCLMGKKPSGRFSKATNRWEDFVQLHQSVMPNVHNNALFLIWHRYFLWTFEQVLRAECGYERVFVWWDETKSAGAFAKSDLFTSPLFFGNLPAPVNGNPVCISTGAFKGIAAHIGPGNSDTTHCISRGVTESNTAQCNTNFINYCLSRTAYADFETCLEYGPHGYGHNGIGGVMQDVWGSPSDPIFWMHHAFVDRVYAAWQAKDPNRLISIDSGVDATGKKLTLNYVIAMGGIRPDVTIGQILNTMSGTSIGGTPFCYKYSY